MNKVCVRGQRIYFYRPPEPIPKLQVNFSRIEFDMDETWSSFLSVVAQFIQNGEPKNVKVEDGYCFVPSELEIGAFELCLRGDDGESVVATVNRLTLEVCEGFDPSGETSLPPSPDLYTQLIKEIDSGKKIAQSVREDADSGKFNGPPGTNGDPGEPGKDGHSPVVTATKSGKTTTISVDGAAIATVEDGADGKPGTDGADGKSAYQYAVEGGFTGTEAEFSGKLAAEIPSVDSTLTQSGQAADAAAVGNRLSALSEEIAAIEDKTNVNSTGWTSAQIALLNQLFDYIPWTNAGAGAIADSLIASLTSASSPEDNITQSGGILTIIALKTEPNQTGNVLTVA